MIVLLFALFIFFCQVLFQSRWISIMKQRKMGQIIKEYGPEGHAVKAGTPSMGGVCFLLVSIISGIAMISTHAITWVDFFSLWSYPVAAALIGFWDDWKKFTSKSSEGLTSIQKFSAQLAITLPWATYHAYSGTPFLPNISLPFWGTLLLLLFLGVGILNAVNVTDGLDGLATGMMCVSLAVAGYLMGNPAISFVIVTLISSLLAFLWDNTHPAKLFMGDVGAHFLGAFLISLCVYNGTFGLVIPLAFLFGIELLSVAIQIIAIRGFNRKVFKMSPLHHHFELLGWKEVRIVVRFWILHLIGIAATLASFKFIFS